MATVRRGSAPHKQQHHTRDDMKKLHRDDFARDQVRGAFAGDENKGPARDHKDNRDNHDTSLKSRRLGRDSDREPIF
ncbi:MAG TPA: hypothetical protein VM432_09030 [Bdellovibrionales bacterium]|nr:hypothetical protein [Bdellovibrionales bacterium]